MARGALFTDKALEHYDNLPPSSPFRQGYLHHFTAGQEAKELADVFGVSKQTIVAAQEVRPEENILATLKYAPHVTREKITPEEEITKRRVLARFHSSNSLEEDRHVSGEKSKQREGKSQNIIRKKVVDKLP